MSFSIQTHKEDPNFSAKWIISQMNVSLRVPELLKSIFSMDYLALTMETSQVSVHILLWQTEVLERLSDFSKVSQLVNSRSRMQTSPLLCSLYFIPLPHRWNFWKNQFDFMEEWIWMVGRQTSDRMIFSVPIQLIGPWACVTNTFPGCVPDLVVHTWTGGGSCSQRAPYRRHCLARE